MVCAAAAVASYCFDYITMHWDSIAAELTIAILSAHALIGLAVDIIQIMEGTRQPQTRQLTTCSLPTSLILFTLLCTGPFRLFFCLVVAVGILTQVEVRWVKCILNLLLVFTQARLRKGGDKLRLPFLTLATRATSRGLSLGS